MVLYKELFNIKNPFTVLFAPNKDLIRHFINNFSDLAEL